MSTQPIILHHFDQSPFSEKIRLIFGLKNIAWTSVRISRIMPRPDLMPLTGGYRRTPVMQIGADVYCDTQCIMRELERRFPEPGLLPKGYEGLAWGSADVDRPLLLPEHGQPGVRLAGRLGASRLHRRPGEAARREIRRRGDDGGNPADARSVSRTLAMDRRSTLRRADLYQRRGRKPLRRQRLHESLVRARASGECRRHARRIRPRACLGRAPARERPRTACRNIERRGVADCPRRDAADRGIARP